MEDGRWRVTEDGGWSYEGYCLQNQEHRIDAEASQSLKVIKNKEFKVVDQFAVFTPQQEAFATTLKRQLQRKE